MYRGVAEAIRIQQLRFSVFEILLTVFD